MDLYTVADIFTKLMVATVLGGMVGWQRERRDRPAGLRTHMLVCIGAAMYTLSSFGFGQHADPSRVASQVATGVGFLGAGTIMRYGSGVRGLTTAASLWAVAAIGICASMGGNAYWVAVLGTALVLLTLTLFWRVETRFLSHSHSIAVMVELAGGPDRLPEIQQYLAAKDLPVESTRLLTTPEGLSEIHVGVRLPSGADLPDLMCYLSALPGFRSMQSS